MRVLPVISLMVNSQECSATGYSSYELFIGRCEVPTSIQPEDSYLRWEDA